MNNYYSWYSNDIVTFFEYIDHEGKSDSKFFNVNIDSLKISSFKGPILSSLLGYYFESFNWSPDNKKLIIITHRERTSLISLYNLKNKAMYKLLSTNDTIKNNIWYPDIIWSPDNKKFAISVKDINPGMNVYKQSSIWVKNIKNGRFEKILNNKIYDSDYYPQDWSMDGEWLLFLFHGYNQRIRNLPIRAQKQFIYNFETKKIYSLKLPKKLNKGIILGWSKNGKDLLVVNKEGIWSIDFSSIPKQVTPIKELNI